MDPEDAGKLIGDLPKRAVKNWVWSAVVVGAIVFTSVAWQVYQTILSKPEYKPASVERMAYPLPDKPSIVVLPFDNMSGDSDQDYIAESISENITAALSSVGDLFVIARNSAFTYKGKPVKVQQVSEELGVRYVLEGSITKSDGKLRVTAQLIDAITGGHIWSDRYDRNFEELLTYRLEASQVSRQASLPQLLVLLVFFRSKFGHPCHTHNGMFFLDNLRLVKRIFSVCIQSFTRLNF